jgi:sugar (pentulose or hexulose) kinase
MHIASIGIDLGKTTFHLVALDEHGKIVGKKKFSRKQLTSINSEPTVSPDGHGSLLRRTFRRRGITQSRP